MPNPIRTAYVPNGEVFVLDVDGMRPDQEVTALQVKLGELRETNTPLLKDAKRFEAIDPDKYKPYESRVADLEEQRGTKSNAFTRLFATAVGAD